MTTEKRGLDWLLGEGNWGPPIAFEKEKKINMSNFYRTGWLPQGKTRGEYWKDAVKRNPDAVCYVDAIEGREILRKDMDEMVTKIGLALIDSGIKKDDKVMVSMPDSIRLAATYLAIYRIGATAVPFHVFYRAKEAKYMLNHSETKLILADELHREFSLARMFAELQQELPQIEKVIIYGNTEPGQVSFDDFWQQEWEKKYPDNYIDRVHLKENPLTAEDTVSINYTSGSTGLLKGVVTNHNLSALIALQIINSANVGPDDSLLNFAVMTHRWGETCLWNAFTMAGLPMYFMSEFEPGMALKVIDKHKPTFLCCAPPHIVALLRHPDFDKTDTACVKIISVAGGILPQAIAKELLERFPKGQEGAEIKIQNAYGGTEGGIVLCEVDNMPPEFMEWSVGRPGISVEAKIVDDNGQVVPVGVAGDMAFKGPLITLSYYKDPERTAQSWRKGWMYLGDSCTMNEDGYLTVHGRTRDIINRGGSLIGPKEVEEFLMNHPEISQVALCRIPDERLVEATCAVIIPMEKGRVFTRAEIKEFMSGKVATIKIPDRVETWDEFPTTPTGKIQKFIMEDTLKKL